ncbi:MAG: site-specific integrase [Deltaproteobacteria bacterium]
MTVRDAIHIFQISQKNVHRKRTTDSYRYLLEHLENHFTDSHVERITPNQIYQFLEALTEHTAKSTRRLRYAQLKAFFNFLSVIATPAKNGDWISGELNFFPPALVSWALHFIHYQ